MSQKNKKSISDLVHKPAEVSGKFEESNFVDTSKPVWNYSLLTDEDVTNYQNGNNYQLYKKFGSHSIQVNDVWGMYFCGRIQ